MTTTTQCAATNNENDTTIRLITLNEVYAQWMVSKLKCAAMGLSHLTFGEFCEFKKMLGFEII